MNKGRVVYREREKHHGGKLALVAILVIATAVSVISSSSQKATVDVIDAPVAVEQIEQIDGVENTPSAELVNYVAEEKKVEPPHTNGCSEYLSQVSKYDWDTNVALAIMRAESGCRANADNTGLNRDGTYDIGLFQINSIHGYSKSFLLDADNNIEVAYKIYKASGWRAWAAYTNGSYLKFL